LSVEKREVGMRAAFFDVRYRVPAAGLRGLLKSQFKRARQGLNQRHETECLDYLEAMAHWHDHKPAECVRRDRRHHILDDNPCSG
jgi:hypothetical protein